MLKRQGALCKCGCGAKVGPSHPTHYDHEPALRLRKINRAGTDYIPPQHSSKHIDARCPASHAVKTHGSGATTAGTDIGKIKKMREHEKCDKPKMRKRQWASRPMAGLPFPKVHRAMRTT